MLTRNGELCQHKVPHYPGLLTDREHKAYIRVTMEMKDTIESCEICQNIIKGWENEVPRLIKLASHGLSPHLPTINTSDRKETWQIFDTFYKKEGIAEVMLCSRLGEDGQEFSVMKKVPPDSENAIEVFGDKHEVFFLTQGKSATAVLEEFLDNERFGLELKRKQLEITIAKGLYQRYPAAICRRVCRAVMPLFGEQAVVDNEQTSVERTSASVKMKL